jgi:dTDP-4-amino-4,6-dideoxygalactose transaminase
VIEDCAQAFGAKYNDKKVGTIGDAGCFSFFPSKNLAGYGDGGMVITKSEEIARQVKMLRNHGSSKRYYHQEIGYNSRLDEIQAAVIRIKLKKIDQFNAARRQNAGAYCAAISSKNIILPTIASGCEHVYHQFTIRAKNRDVLANALQKKDIASAVYYPVPLNQQEVFLKLHNASVKMPVSENCAQEVLSLPMFPELNQEEIGLIADVINNAS